MESYRLAWWVWVVGGLVLMGAEMLTPGGFFALFLGCAAMAVGILSAAGMPGGVAVQGLCFLVFSGIAILLLRKPLLARFPQPTPTAGVDQIAGETAVALNDIEPGAYGQVELRGSTWKARSVGTGKIGAGTRCLVDAIDGLTLLVRNS